MRRRNPEGETVILLGAAAAAAWWLWQRSQGAPAAGGLSAPAAASIVASAITAAGVPPPATLSTTVTGPGQVNAGDVLVSGFDANGNPVQVWTGPGTVNPQAGEIAGANPGLAQLAQYMGMTTAQTQAWLTANTK